MKNTDTHDKMTNNKNAGFSLVELIVVIAIMGVMVGVVSYGVSLLFSRDAEAVAKQINDNLSEARMVAMSKPGRFSLCIEVDSEGYMEKIVIYRNEEGSFSTYRSVEPEKKAKVSCAGAYTSADGVGFEVAFKNNGSLEYVGDVRSSSSTATGASGVYEISVESRNRTEVVSLVSETGRHFVNE